MQLREYIKQALYHPELGYFTGLTPPVGSLPEPIPFTYLPGQQQYFEAVQAAYKQLQVSWLTPVEIFSPHYGAAVANCILHMHRQVASPGEALRIWEIGGGTGTLARDVLDRIRRCAPDAYRHTSYTSVEVSRQLADLQLAKVAQAGHENFSVQCRDALGPQGWGSCSHPCFVVMMEVLDNLPHDRVVQRPHDRHQPWLETWVEQGEAGNESTASSIGSAREVLQPLQDPLITRCLQAWWDAQGASFGGWVHSRLMPKLIGSPGPLFLPTAALRLLDVLHSARPNHILIAQDFDDLQAFTSVPGVNAPLVAETVDGHVIDHPSYLTRKGHADIFFPSDFKLLTHMYRHALAHHDAHHEATGRSSGGEQGRAQGSGNGNGAGCAMHVKAQEFMRRYADVAATRSVSGYNPLLQDYTNTSFFVGSAMQLHM